jgi:catechol 2,3-dioxygenase-like lactoylglutathione lyase family enzyme/nitrite reductase/ring-hydroxylating ferredoxin subunit
MSHSGLHNPDSVAGTSEEPRVNGFSHLTVQVTDLDRSGKFYQDVFGLDLIGRNLVNEEAPNSLLAMNSRERVVLVKAPEVQPFRPNSSSIHHAWWLTPEQFERAQKRLQAMGFKIDDNRKAFRPLGELNMDVYDPDGHRYQIQTITAEGQKPIIEIVSEAACGHVDDHPIGAVKQFAKGKFFLVRLEDGFLAMSRWCTHKNGLLTWRKEHWHFHCPMHGAVFNRRGDCVSYSRRYKALRLHPVTIASDGTITVRPDTVIERDQFDPSQVIPADCTTNTLTASMTSKGEATDG